MTSFDEPTAPQKEYCLELHREHILLEMEIVKLQNLNDLDLQESFLQSLRDKWRNLKQSLTDQNFTRDTISENIKETKANKAELKKILWREQNRHQLEQEDLFHIQLPDGIYRKLKSATPDESDPQSYVIYQVKKAVHGSGRKVARQLIVTTQVQHIAVMSEDAARNDGFTWSDDANAWEKIIHKGKWFYKGLASKYLTEADRMSIEEAKEWGKLYSICARCGATLVDPVSIELGMGPTCRGAKDWL